MTKSSTVIIKKVANGFSVVPYSPYDDLRAYCYNDEFVFSTLGELCEHLAKFYDTPINEQPQPPAETT